MSHPVVYLILNMYGFAAGFGMDMAYFWTDYAGMNCLYRFGNFGGTLQFMKK